MCEECEELKRELIQAKADSVRVDWFIKNNGITYTRIDLSNGRTIIYPNAWRSTIDDLMLEEVEKAMDGGPRSHFTITGTRTSPIPKRKNP